MGEPHKIYYLVGDICKKDECCNEKIYYFDNNATTLIYDDNVKEGIIKWISCGNPSNILHDFGLKAHNKIEQCRHSVARDLHVYPEEVYFTSGATESNNIVIQGIFHYYMEQSEKEKVTMITSSFEHPSVLNIFKHFEKSKSDQFEIIYVNPSTDKNSPFYKTIDPKDIAKAIDNANYKVVLVSIMFANNETGAMQDIKSIGRICKKNNIMFHSDATQAIGKYIIHPKKYCIDAMSFSGHKFHGPKGIGGLFIDKHVNKILNLCYGGEQEEGKRPGTENVAHIIGMTLALEEVHKNRKEKNKKLLGMKKYIIDYLKKYENVEILCPENDDRALPNTILIMLKNMGTCNKVFVRELNKSKIYVSVGSACQTQAKSSHVLDTIGIDPKDKLKIIRISLSDYTNVEECTFLVQKIVELLKIDKNIIN